MPTKPLTIVATLRAKPGREAALREELLALIPPTRMEEGFIQYDLHQSLDNPGLFIFYENWKDRVTLDAHATSPHLKAFLAKGNELLAAPLHVEFMERIG